MDFIWQRPQSILKGNCIFEKWTKFYSKYMAYSKSSEDKPLSLLLYAGGNKMPQICSLLSHYDVSLKQLNELLMHLEPFCMPYLLLMFERYKLASCKQTHSEDIERFLHRLEKRASKCNFIKDQDGILVSRIIEGISQNDIKDLLHQKQGLDFAKASALCREYSRSTYDSASCSGNAGLHQGRTIKGGLDCGMKQYSNETESDTSLYESHAYVESGALSVTVSKSNTIFSGHQKVKVMTLSKNDMHKKDTGRRMEEYGMCDELKTSDYSHSSSVNQDKYQDNGSSTFVEKKKIIKIKSDPRGKGMVASKCVNVKHKQQKFACEVCGQSFKCQSLLKRHVIKHSQDRPFSCTICGQKLKRKAQIKVHMRKHNNQRDFKCSECGFAFRSSANLRVHMRTHTGERPYSCEICYKAYAHLSSLNSHKSIHKTDVTDDKIYKYTCEVCGKSFYQKTSFIHHVRTHTGEKPYPCSECEKRFLSSTLLKQHIRIHTGEKPFICDICGKRFRQSQNLHMHKKGFHSGKRSYVCDICGATYIYTKNLKQHKRSVHSMNKPGNVLNSYRDLQRNDDPATFYPATSLS